MEEEQSNNHQNRLILAALPIVALLGWMAWIAFTRTDNGLNFLITTSVGVGLLGLTWEGLNTGKLGVKTGYIQREQHPIAYWVFVIFYILLGFVLIGLGVNLVWRAM